MLALYIQKPSSDGYEVKHVKLMFTVVSSLLVHLLISSQPPKKAKTKNFILCKN